MNKGIRRVRPPPSTTGAQNHRGRFQTLSSPQEVFRSISELAERWGNGAHWSRNLQGASPAKQVPFSPEATRRVRPWSPPSASGASRGILDRLGLGWGSSRHHFPPQLRKVRAGEYSLFDSGGGRGGRAPLHPTPSRQAGRGRGPDSGGRAGLSSLSSPPRADLRLPPPPAAPPQPPPVPKAALGRGGPGRGRGVVAARGQGAAAGPGWNKVRRPGPGSSRRPARLRRAVCKHKVSQ